MGQPVQDFRDAGVARGAIGHLAVKIALIVGFEQSGLSGYGGGHTVVFSAVGAVTVALWWAGTMQKSGRAG
jgi:hypothetical protein